MRNMHMNTKALGRWIAAVALLGGAVAFHARTASAVKSLNTYMTNTDVAHCATDASFNPYYAQGDGADGSGIIVCYAISNGGTVTTACPTGAIHRVRVKAGTAIQCSPSPAYQTTWTSADNCSFAPAVHGSCAAGNTVQGTSYGTN